MRWGIWIGGIALCIAAAGLVINSKPGPTPYSFEEPLAPLPQLVQPEGNALTLEGVRLGRALFYDPILSRDSAISCASCHHPERAFTDGRALPIGTDGRIGRRSAMSLVNVGFYYKGLFWDGRVATLEEQALHPITDPNEMAADWPLVLKRLEQHPSYRSWFEEAFQLSARQPIAPEQVAKALAQFQRTLISRDSKFDRVKRGEDTFTESEARGWAIFFDADPLLSDAECNHCHNEPLFTDQTFSNNGLDHAPNLTEFNDPGRAAISGKPTDAGRFRVPTLRNIALTAPYMHDGRFETLEQVLQHYNQGGHYAVNVSPNVRPLHLSNQDQADLLAFLYTLTDTTSLRQEAWQNPFDE